MKTFKDVKLVIRFFAASTSKVVSKANPPPLSADPCVVCKGKHPLWKCASFKEKPVNLRAKLVAENRLCFKCISGKHPARECTKDIKCSHSECGKAHNSLLHGAERVFPPAQKQKAKTPSKPVSSEAPTSSASTTTVSASAPLSTTCLYASVPPNLTKGFLPIGTAVVSSNTGSEKVLIMCDNGSSNTWITTGLANKLNLSSPMSFQVGLNGINVASTVETGLVEA